MIYIYPDYDTAERSDEAGMFQVISIREDEKDITNKIYQGEFYHSSDQVIKDLGLDPDKTDC